ncbi:MAG TPA: NAD(P)-dependent oxidoreductase [Bacteroidales bacterium]|nr:NAD(P)-dependent oxidoreductase [Bacteroidales bacterium]HSA42707.1 NAD(P)-dependent oxidoreductase [Bacteroidales bacterium]
MTKVLVATEKPFAALAVEGIRNIVQEAGFEFALLENYTDVSALLNAVKDADALIVRSDIVSKEVVDAAPLLKIVVRAGAGYDNLDLAACSAKGVVAMNTPGQNANAVAELAFGLMLFHLRKGFSGKSGTELRGKTLGIHAYGNVGKFVALIAKGFGMEVFGYDPFIPAEKMTEAGVIPLSSAEELYGKCQYVSLHIPATADTKRSINLELLKRMPKGATLVNTARKEVICEESLLKMLEERKDFSYLSDIEPDCKEQLLASYPGRCVFTAKKMGAQTEEANINAGLAAARQIAAFIKNGDKTFQVNP